MMMSRNTVPSPKLQQRCQGLSSPRRQCCHVAHATCAVQPAIRWGDVPMLRISPSSCVSRGNQPCHLQRQCPVSIHPPHFPQEEASPLRKVALGAMTAASVAGIALQAPMDAQAVFGGGGVGTPLNDEDFSNRDMRGVIKFDFSKAQIRRAKFVNSNLEGMSFYGAIAPNANFHGANLKLANLDSADLEGADLSDAVLEEAYVSNTQFRGTNIANTDWTEVQLRSDQRKFLCSIASGVNPKTNVDTRESLLCPE